MPRPTKGARLGSTPQHQQMMLGGLASALIMHEQIRTTETKAKRLRPVAEKLITLSKAGDVHSRRQALAVIEDRDVIHKLFSDLGPRFAQRDGGYTRILKLGPRKGDAAPMVIIELVDGPTHKVSSPSEDEKKSRRFARRGRKGIKPAEEPSAAAEGADVEDMTVDPELEATVDTPEIVAEADVDAATEDPKED